jgi:hypothetical protein
VQEDGKANAASPHTDVSLHHHQRHNNSSSNNNIKS